jgi:enoyl-CoA hydratase/carnithine racemase
MPTSEAHADLAVTADGAVAVIEIRRPPLNFFDAALIGRLVQALQALDDDASCRSVVLAAPLAVRDMRQTLCAGLADQVRAAMAREVQCQPVHMGTADFREGVRAAAERREPRFIGA